MVAVNFAFPGLVPALAKERKITVAGVRYVVLFPDDLDIGKIAAELFMGLPIGVAMMAHQYIGTEKLQLQLERGIGEPTDKVLAGQQFFRASLLAQLGVDNVPVILKGLLGASPDIRIYLRCS